MPESVKKVLVHVRPVRELMGSMKLSKVTADDVETYIDDRRQMKKVRGTGFVSPSKINRETDVLRAALRLAQGKGKLARVPAILKLDEPEPRQGFWSLEEFELFVVELPDDDHRDVAWCGFWTGWRRKEVFTLPWKYVDWKAAPRPEIRIPKTKNRKPRVIPLLGPLLEVFRRRWESRTVKNEDGTAYIVDLVFHQHGKPFADYRRPWASAFKAARIPRRTWHDFRRTAVRNMVNAGVPEKVAMEISGHVTRSIFDRYHIVAQEEKADAMEKTFEFVSKQPSDPRVRPIRRPASKKG